MHKIRTDDIITLQAHTSLQQISCRFSRHTSPKQSGYFNSIRIYVVKMTFLGICFYLNKRLRFTTYKKGILFVVRHFCIGQSCHLVIEIISLGM